MIISFCLCCDSGDLSLIEHSESINVEILKIMYLRYLNKTTAWFSLQVTRAGDNFNVNVGYIQNNHLVGFQLCLTDLQVNVSFH